ncbi:MAG: hypothetical protein Q9162_002701 [Coniocarpon cinnabarinum]
MLKSKQCRLLKSSVARRGYAIAAPGGPGLQVFNRNTKWLQRQRSAVDAKASRKVDYLRDEVAARLSERLLDINRSFDHVLDLGANACNIARALTKPPSDAGYDVKNTKDTPPVSERIARITCADSSSNLLYRDEDLPFNQELNITREVLGDEETLPYESSTFDAVMSSLSLHWINDLPSVLKQVNNVLKPDAPLIACMLGGDSLFELRTSLQLADLDRHGGVSTHVSPLADVRDMGGLLQSAGFKLLTVDVDDIVVDFPDTLALMSDLQAMGENNAVLMRDMAPIQRDVLLAAEGIYRELHGNEDGTVPATFRLIYLIGWKEAQGQEQPLQRGTGQVNLQDALSGGGGFGPGQKNQ